MKLRDAIEEQCQLYIWEEQKDEPITLDLEVHIEQENDDWDDRMYIRKMSNKRNKKQIKEFCLDYDQDLGDINECLLDGKTLQEAIEECCYGFYVLNYTDKEFIIYSFENR